MADRLPIALRALRSLEDPKGVRDYERMNRRDFERLAAVRASAVPTPERRSLQSIAADVKLIGTAGSPSAGGPSAPPAGGPSVGPAPPSGVPSTLANALKTLAVFAASAAENAKSRDQWNDYVKVARAGKYPPGIEVPTPDGTFRFDDLASAHDLLQELQKRGEADVYDAFSRLFSPARNWQVEKGQRIALARECYQLAERLDSESK